MSSVFAKRGYAGNYVEKLQRKLNTVVVPELEPDGKFGSKTEAAVRSYQELMNLEPDGIVGVFTDAVLFGKAFDKLYRRPGFVEQANPKLCWAAATESWLTTRPERRNRSQQDIRAGLAAEGWSATTAPCSSPMASSCGSSTSACVPSAGRPARFTRRWRRA